MCDFLNAGTYCIGEKSLKSNGFGKHLAADNFFSFVTA